MHFYKLARKNSLLLMFVHVLLLKTALPFTVFTRMIHHIIHRVTVEFRFMKYSVDVNDMSSN